MTNTKRALVLLALAASISISASAFNPSGLVKNVAGNVKSGLLRQPIATK